MSIQAVAWALEQDLPQGPKLVLVSVANHANHVDGYCFLRADTIAREASCSPRSVFRYVGALRRNGYLRREHKKGEDGKQRANDYWILFDRAEVAWDWGMQPEDEPETEAPTGEDEATAEAQDVAEPYANLSHGERPDRVPPVAGGGPVERPSLSHGPCDSSGSRKESAEPSESNPKASSARARVQDRALRSYQPPPPQPIAADVGEGQPVKQIFVYDGTPAYEAWAKEMARRTGVRSWHLKTTANINGKWHSGWYFPTLFPPSADKPAGPDPPQSSAA